MGASGTRIMLQRNEKPKNGREPNLRSSGHKVEVMEDHTGPGATSEVGKEQHSMQSNSMKGPTLLALQAIPS